MSGDRAWHYSSVASVCVGGGSPHLPGHNYPLEVRASCKQDEIFLVGFLGGGAQARGMRPMSQAC